MANSLDMNTPIALEGRATPTFESDWHEVTLLTTAETAMDVGLLLFDNGYATPYFESLWSGAAIDLSKDALDISIKLEQDGYPTVELEAIWEDLIT